MEAANISDKEANYSLANSTTNNAPPITDGESQIKGRFKVKHVSNQYFILMIPICY